MQGRKVFISIGKFVNRRKAYHDSMNRNLVCGYYGVVCFCSLKLCPNWRDIQLSLIISLITRGGNIRSK